MAWYDSSQLRNHRARRQSQPDSVSRYPSCDTLICNSSNSVLGLPNTSLHLQIPLPFIWKSNVGLTTSTYGSTMFSNIGWIGVSKSSEKSFRSLTVCWTIEGSVSSEESDRGIQQALKRAPGRIQIAGQRAPSWLKNCGDFANVTFANVFGRFANVLLVTSPTPNI